MYKILTQLQCKDEGITQKHNRALNQSLIKLCKAVYISVTIAN